MKLSEIKEILTRVDEINFELPDGTLIPPHFHVTEVGKVEKHFIDCGGTERKETAANFQLWTADDYDHRLSSEKLTSIINLSEKRLKLPDVEIEVEYQSDTIGKYGLSFDGWNFQLITKQTDCLAKEGCGIPQPKQKMSLSEIGKKKNNSCSPNSDCC